MPGFETSPLNNAAARNVSPNEPLNPRRIISSKDLEAEKPAPNPFAPVVQAPKFGPNVVDKSDS